VQELQHGVRQRRSGGEGGGVRGCGFCAAGGVAEQTGDYGLGEGRVRVLRRPRAVGNTGISKYMSGK
jgi:hypothetical protein